MISNGRILRLCNILQLSPYQTYILEHSGKKYDLDKLVKRGNVLYAPYRCDDKKSISEYVARIFFGPRCDLIGIDRMLIRDERGIKVHHFGFYSARKNGTKYYADPMGNRIHRNFVSRLR